MEPIPQRLRIGIGGHFGPSYGVELESGLLVYTSSKQRKDFPPECDSRTENIHPTTERWQAFRAALDQLNVWCWQSDYPNSAMVCDGTGWTVEISYSDRSLVSSGENCFPGWDGRAVPITEDGTDNTFAKFCRAVARLTGRQFR
jgi:hypothetical protein